MKGPVEMYVPGLAGTYATRLDPLSRRPLCTGCEARAWWLLNDGRVVCSSCLTRHEVALGVVFVERPAAAFTRGVTHGRLA